MTDQPKRAFVIKIDAGGDTLKDAISIVKHFLFEMEARDARSIVTGGYSNCGILEVQERKGFTHDQFEAELEQYLSSQKQLEQPKDADFQHA
jgi:hypothetical protein